ncbi:MAG: class I SAM-dependent methyltransferase [Acidobacteriota bacterium]|nr:class I SAM-dependent methyltransferase [Acidobacteriota bacterium]
MTLLNKFGIGGDGSRQSRPVASNSKAPAAVAPAASTGSPRAPEQHVATRVSNGLKEFLWNLDGLGRGTLLDLGPAWQTTLNFFIERGFRVSSEDILRGWKSFLDEDEGRLREDPTYRDKVDLTPDGRATRFLKSNLQYPPASFDAVLLWDVLDYLDPAMTRQTITCLTELLRPAGIVFAMFHSKKPEGFQRYRVADSNTLQVIPASIVTPPQKIYQNREIQDLFSHYRTMKSFVGRDQLRETLFIK